MIAIDPTKQLTRCDEDGVPCVIQTVRYHPSWTYIEFELFNGQTAHIRSMMLTNLGIIKKKKKLSKKDFHKINRFVEKHMLSSFLGIDT